TSLCEHRVQRRCGYGTNVFTSSDARGLLVGGLISGEDDEVLVIMEKGKLVRSSVAEVSATGRHTMGVIFAKPDANDRIVMITRNVEQVDDELDDEDNAEDTVEGEEPDAGESTYDGES